jgi:hypothetical protein
MRTPRLPFPISCLGLALASLALGCPAATDNSPPAGPGGSGDDDGSGTGAGPGGPDDDSATSADDGEDDVDDDGGSSSGGDSDDGMIFILTPDGGTGGIFECDLFAQDCESGTKCMPWANDGGAAWNSTRCSPIAASPGQAGDDCAVEGSGVSGVDDCDIGLMCWNVDEQGVGVCEDMCTGSADNPICEDPNDACSIANNGAIVLCLQACDPLIQDCEVENEVCYPINEDWVCAPDASGDTGAYGDPCEYINACDPGSVCVGAQAFTNCPSAQGCCSVVCDVTAPDADDDCTALDPGQTCEPWYVEGMAPPGYETLGVCALPL